MTDLTVLIIIHSSWNLYLLVGKRKLNFSCWRQLHQNCRCRLIMAVNETNRMCCRQVMPIKCFPEYNLSYVIREISTKITAEILVWLFSFWQARKQRSNIFICLSVSNTKSCGSFVIILHVDLLQYFIKATLISFAYTHWKFDYRELKLT